MSFPTGSGKRLGWMALRLAVAVFCWATALYACLASSAFTYRQFIRGPLFPWVGTFAKWHASAASVVLLLAVASLAGAFAQGGPARRLSIWFIGVWAAICIALQIHPILPGLKDDLFSIAVVIVAVVPLVWLGVIDHLRAAGHLHEGDGRLTSSQLNATEQHMLSVAVVAAAFATIVYAVFTPIFASHAFEPDLLTVGLATGLFASAVDHLVIFFGAALVIVLVERSTHTIERFHVRYSIEIVLLTAACSFVMQQTMGQAIGLSGMSGWLVVVPLAASVVVTWAGLSIVGRMDDGLRSSSALDVLCGPPSRGWQGGRRLAAFAGITAVAMVCAVELPIIDWDFVLLKSSVTIVWMAIFVQIYRTLPRERTRSAVVTAAIVLTPLLIHGVQARGIDAAVRLADPQFSTRRTLNRYLVYNPSFRLADSVLDGGTASQPDFGRYLRANTGLGIDVRPVDLSLVPDAQPAPVAVKPFIFLFIIDTLRPDYLSPYNREVSFTPQLARFADESVVFRNAFTRYGGTGLSVPAIWMGAASVHKQYVQPFHPMNTLEKLLDVNGYRRFLSLDIVMEPLLRPSPATSELDHGLLTRDLRLCQTLDELGHRLPETPDDGPPIFVYSLPQDLHTASLIGARTPAGESYPGFNEPYAARVHAIDTCFGAFIDLLKARRIYDRSLIVVTSDHGELLGEDRRWGHAYYLFPEVLQIPLIMHFPRGVLDHQAIDPKAVALTTDITPTVYAALGYHPRRETTLVGQPLIAEKPKELGPRRTETYVFAASYGAVYAVLRQNGRRLYVVDAVKDEEYGYERRALGRWSPVEVTAGLRAVNQRAIREYIDEISRVYHVNSGP